VLENHLSELQPNTVANGKFLPHMALRWTAVSYHSSTIQSRKRYDWVNAFTTASLHMAIAGLGVRLTSSLSFQDLNLAYISAVRANISAVTSFPTLYLTNEEARYLFQLESELWGSDYRHYLAFFNPSYPTSSLLETFKFTHAFYLLERWLRAFMPPSATGKRRSERDSLFHETSGILTNPYRPCLASLGVPFNLLSSASSTSSAVPGAWAPLRTTRISVSLARLYSRLSNCYNHPFPIVESSFRSTTRELRKRFWKRTQPRFHGFRSTWYDVMWRYSETVRYHAISPAAVTLQQPFYWNRCLRWCSSLIVTGLLELADRSGGSGRISTLWRNSMPTNPILRNVFGTSRN
jgi:hypothetical protein